jgi:hypothetical protein
MRGLFKEEVMCEDLASAYNMVPERSGLCVWTPDAAAQGRAALLPYVATLDLDLEADLEHAERDRFLFFRGGCGHPDPSIKHLFAAGKMLRHDLVAALRALAAPDVEAECSCDICDNRLRHPALMAAYRRATFCPVVPSNAQSSRRLSEAVLSGCVPVFLGPPFHTLPLAQDIDWPAVGVFINISDSGWIDPESPNHLRNALVARMWRLDDPGAEAATVSVATVADAVAYLRAMPAAEVAAKRRAALKERLKLFYGPVPEALGGDGRSSELGELLMRRMCRHAAANKRRLAAAAAEGVDWADSDVHLSLDRKRAGAAGGGDKPRGWFSLPSRA